jgi:hypothetical protein
MNTPNTENDEIKEVTIAGETYRFAPLTMEQIERFIDAPDAPEDYKASRGKTWNTIHASLLNASTLSGAPEITVEELKKKHSLKGFLALHRAALEASGLRDPELVQ